MRNIFYRTLATLIFFTRLPFWRIANVPKEHYERIVPLWPLAGWITGGVMALTFLIASTLLPVSVSIIAAILARVMITGALHEDGFADFCDGFGGGTSRERILAIMKDSHIGSYGVIGLIIYYALLFATLNNIPPLLLPPLFIMADTLAKWSGANVINILPYARKESEAKNKLVYQRMKPGDIATSALLTLLPVGLMSVYSGLHIYVLIPMTATAVTAALLFLLMHKKIQGYTGDCCGATFIICELVFYVCALATIS